MVAFSLALRHPKGENQRPRRVIPGPVISYSEESSYARFKLEFPAGVVGATVGVTGVTGVAGVAAALAAAISAV
jgi:hypothetical protein